jgi:hypothetical protein
MEDTQSGYLVLLLVFACGLAPEVAAAAEEFSGKR